ncbi:MAG: DNA-processing protein DprA [Myxococcota bacterium]
MSRTITPLDADERAARLAIWCARGVGRTTFDFVLDQCHGEAARFFRDRLHARAVLARRGIRRDAAEGLRALLAGPPPSEIMEAQSAEGVRVFVRGDEGFPLGFGEGHASPGAIFVRGDISRLKTSRGVAMVGSRRAPHAQLGRARLLAERLAERGVWVISGGALGMDAAAHWGALDAGCGSTVWLAGDVRHPTPSRHRELFERVLDAGGALASEFPRGVFPKKDYYVRRNRLIVATSELVVVLYARALEKSGTMWTVDHAHRLGRPVAALVPEPEDYEAAATRALLARQGALCIFGHEDVLWHLGRSERPPAHSEVPAPRRSSAGTRGEDRAALRGVSEEARALLEEIRSAGSYSLDAIGLRMGLLLELELAGAVRKVQGASRFEVVHG